MKKILFIAILFLSLGSVAQDFTFSQFYEMPLLRNPALAGVFSGDIRVAVVHRNQWASVTVPFKTSAMDIEWKSSVFADDYLTFGLQASHDVAGDVKLKRTQILPVINYHLSVSQLRNSYLSMAFMGGSVQTQFDPTQAKMDDQFINGAFSPANVSAQSFSATGYRYWDASVGMSYASDFGEASKYYVGMGLFHFMEPRVNFFQSNSDVKLKKKIVFNAAISTPINDRNELVVYADYFKQGGNGQFFGGAMYEMLLHEYEEEKDRVSFSLGAFYRWGDALVPVAKMNLHELTIGVSYDVNVSKLSSASRMQGGLELTLSYQGFWKGDHSSRDKVRCVSFK